ncbi:MAG: isoprenylcysteine carboxylmethyltransferase family protein [Blastocatellia bacterium]|nr:isoprenylcysteine carboxylmethyltransferase family protein [Blastocatellia bacterium]
MNFRRLAQRIRVPVGFIFAPLLLIAARPTTGSLMAGSVVALAGLAVRAWASGYLKKNEEIATRGPYAHTRNPLYLGTLLMGGGVTISAGTPWLVALFAALYLIIYLPVMLAEAETVNRLFPEEYHHYSRHVPLFVPHLRPYQPQVDGSPESPAPLNRKGFDSALYLRHREYRAALGLLAAYGLLVAKLYLSGGR